MTNATAGILAGFFIHLLACSADPGDPDRDAAPPIDPEPDRWQSLGPVAAFALNIVYAPDDPDRVFLGMDDGGGIWRSDDAGETFELVTEELIDVLAWALVIDPHSPERLYAGDAHGRGVYLSRDGGDTWAYANVGLDSFDSREVVDLAIDPQDGDTIYAATLDGLYVSRDAGDSWTRSRAGSPDDDPAHQPCLRVTAAEIEGQVVVLATTGEFDPADRSAPNRVFLSRDGGASFDDLTPMLLAAGAQAADDALAATVSAIEVDPRERILVSLAVGPDGGDEPGQPGTILRSDDGGASFERLPIDVLSLAVQVTVSPDDPDRIVVSGSYDMSPMIYVSDDDGASFSPRGDMNGEAILQLSVAVDPADPDHIWVGTYSELLESRDGGQSWRIHNADIPQTCPTGLAVAEEAGSPVIYAGLASHNGLLSRRNAFRYHDEEWVEMPLPSDGYAVVVLPGSSRSIVAGTLQQGLYFSDDGGASFDSSQGTPHTDFTVFSLLAAGGDVVLAGAVGVTAAGLFRSTDGGRSFSAVALDRPAIPASFTQVGDSIFAVGEGGVARSDDHGASWEELFASDDELVTIVALDEDGTTLLLGDAGGRLRRSDDGGRTFEEVSDAFEGKAQISRLIRDPRDGSLLAGVAAANNFVRSLDRFSGLWRSTDQGATWSLAAIGEQSTHIYNLAWDPTVPGRLYAAMWCSGVRVIDLTPTDPGSQ